MPEETLPVPEVNQPVSHVDATPGLAAAIEKFQEKFAEGSYSQRHTDLGKMINCPKCGLRHRQSDPLMNNSAAHGEQKMATLNHPSRAAVTKGKRILAHHSARLLQLVERTRKIFHEDIELYFHEEGQRLVLRARRRALIQLTRERLVESRAYKQMQNTSRRINQGLLPGGSRFSHPVKNHGAK